MVLWHSNYEAMGIYVLGLNSLIPMVGDGNEHHSMGLKNPIKSKKLSIIEGWEVGIANYFFASIFFNFAFVFLVNKTTFNPTILTHRF